MAESDARKKWLAENRDRLNAYHREWSKKNRDKIRGYVAATDPAKKKAWDKKKGRKYRAAHPEKVRMWARKNQAKLRAERPEVARARLRAWKLANPEKVKALDARYMARHGEAVRAKARKRVAANREKYAATSRRWRKENPEKHAMKHQRRRAAIRGASGNGITGVQWKDMKNSYLGLCAYCSESSDNLQLDHIDPLSRGGAHDLSNAAPACPRCNQSKSNTPLLVW